MAKKPGRVRILILDPHGKDVEVVAAGVRPGDGRDRRVLPRQVDARGRARDGVPGRVRLLLVQERTTLRQCLRVARDRLDVRSLCEERVPDGRDDLADHRHVVLDERIEA
ncbi:MAG: hypothetical protein ACI9PP_000820, partial [Halobacteriales archaeon]